MINDLVNLMQRVNGVLWGPWTLYLLLTAGLIFTLWSRFSQFRVLTHGYQVIRGRYDKPDDPGAINHFQALSAALSATIGLGNIGGVAVAISLGGPGALFWMWVVGFLGMALKMVEITLTMLYRNTDDPDDPHGGAMWVIDRTLGRHPGGRRALAKVFGFTFSITCVLMTMAGGNMFQTANVASLSKNYFGIPAVATGIVLALAVGMVIVGGIKRIGRVAGRLVPFMCLLYLLSGLAVLALNVDRIPELIWLILRSAFSPTEASGAFLGASVGFAFSWGLKRAAFSNEAGLGSAPIAHAAAKTHEPAREGIVGSMGPFIDTLCICTLTAMVILITDTWNRPSLGPFNGAVQLKVEADPSGATQWAIQAPDRLDVLPDISDAEPPHPWYGWQEGWAFFLTARLPAEAGPPTSSRPIRFRVFGKVERQIARPDDPATHAQPYLAWTKLEPTPPVPASFRPGRTVTLSVDGVYREYTGAAMTALAFDRAFPGLGKWLVTLAAWLFAFSTMISWSYYGEQATIYMVGKRGVLSYKLLFLALAVAGAVIVRTDRELGALADFGTGGMLWANMMIVLLMAHHSMRCLRDYWRRLKSGEIHPVDQSAAGGPDDPATMI